MPDNTGPYLSYEELLTTFIEEGSDLVALTDTTLANKVTDPIGDTFEYTGGTPKLYDVLYQSGEYATIIGVLTGPARVRVNKTGADSTIIAGSAQFARSTKLTKKKAETLIAEKSAYVDTVTRQFFNKRSGTYQLEGNNTPTLLLQVPIISIDSLVINSTDTVLYEGEDKDFVAFRGRAEPQDDRRNPRIKLNVGRGRDSIFTGMTHRVFARKTLTTIEGSFGFLEPDGSTPPLIKKAVKLLCVDEVVEGLTTAEAESTGPLRRVRVDLHEKEFFESSGTAANKKAASGIAEVDQILAMYRSPIAIGGSFVKMGDGFRKLENE